jgi:hypothetical protein
MDILSSHSGGYPDHFPPRALDAAQGTDADDMHAGEVRAVQAAISQLDALAELLRGIEGDDMAMNMAAWNGADALEAVSAKLARAVG